VPVSGRRRPIDALDAGAVARTSSAVNDRKVIEHSPGAITVARFRVAF
jgi:hypothetical protein